MVSARRTCRQYLDVIDGSQRNWRSLILKEVMDDYDPSILDQFDRRSQSTMVEVTFKTLELETKDKNHLVKSLLRSKYTLQTLNIDDQYGEYHSDENFLPIEQFPNLVDCRVLNTKRYCSTEVQLKVIEKQSGKRTKGLQVLWAFNLPSTDQGLDFCRNLSSLFVVCGTTSTKWSKLLGRCSRTLKHLGIHIFDPTAFGKVSPLDLTCLEVMELRYTSPRADFLSSFRIASTCKVISRAKIPSRLPSISELWTGSCVSDWEPLERFCPSLEILRIDSVGKKGDLGNMDASSLLLSLRRRRENSKAGLEVNGIKMRPIRKLVVPFQKLPSWEAEGLKMEVKELVDSETLPFELEVEI